MTADSKKLLTGVIVVIVIILGYWFLNMPDNRTGSQRVGDAIHDLDKGPAKAARQLEDRTPGQKVGDAVKDAGDDIKRNTNR